MDSQANRDADSKSYLRHAKDFVELHDQVETSVSLLDSLESFLSTFQKDLSTVSGQIADLQERSKDIENRLKARRKIEKPLSSLISDLCISPELATVILDTEVREPWLTAIFEFEQRLNALKARKRVKAARDLSEVAEGLRIVAATKIRAFFLALMQPIRTSVSTNMQILQTSVLVKYKLLYSFLSHHAPDVGHEIQQAYIAAARVYYETGFRRYTRGLGWIKARTSGKSETIAVAAREQRVDMSFDEKSLALAKIEGPGVTLGYMADDKAHKEPVEALFRSMLLVLMDNATAEYAFITTFFSELGGAVSLPSPTSFEADYFRDRRSTITSDFPGFSPLRRTSAAAISDQNQSKEEQSKLNATWKQIMEPTLTYCQTLSKAFLDPPLNVVSLLIMIRLIEEVMAEVQKRECSPLESYIFTMRLDFWPVFQKLMTEHVQSLNKLNDSATGGYFSRGTTVTESMVQNMALQYVNIFMSFVLLTQEAETMIFSNLQRLRQELTQLIITQSGKITDPMQGATYQSVTFEVILQALSKGQLPAVHPKATAEVAYWKKREEEARRRITSTRSARR